MLKCELCGSALIKIDDNVFACEGCGCKYTKEQALKLLGINPESTTPTPAPASNDFVIVAGVLKKYTGSAVDVEVPEGVLEIDQYAFSGMTSLRSVKLPDGIKHIPRMAFSYCSSLKSITLPQGLKEIQQDAFMGCESLTELIIPDSVDKIGDAHVRSDVVYGSVCENCPNLTVRMPSRFNPLVVAGCKHLYDLSGNRMDMADEFIRKQNEQIKIQYRRKNHLCLACGGEIGIFSNKCKRCGKPFGTE